MSIFSSHGIQQVPDLLEILKNGFILQKILESSKREGRVLRKMENTINTYENIYMKIIGCNGSYNHF